MSVHLIKLSVGPESLAELEAWQNARLAQLRARKQPLELMHITRHTPKRSDELLRGGSIYWVIKGMLCARQTLLDFRPLVHDGVAHCGIVYAPNMVRVVPRPHRAFQGWRYLAAKDAPPDLAISPHQGTAPADDQMLQELAALGLL